MACRYKLSGHKSRRMFRRGASKIHKRNSTNYVMRGGIRL